VAHRPGDPKAVRRSRSYTGPIRAVIFDLDDTLYDCTGTLVWPARQKAAEVIARTLSNHALDDLQAVAEEDPSAGMVVDILRRHQGRCTLEAALEIQAALEAQYGPYFLAYDELARIFRLGPEFVENCRSAYESARIENIAVFPDVFPTLEALKQNYPELLLFLVTAGTRARQEEKIRLLGLAPPEDEQRYFQRVVVAGQRLPQLEQHFVSLLREFHLQPWEVLCVGDRIREELRIGKEMGLLTAQFLHGRYSVVAPRSPEEEPDYVLHRISQLPTLLELRARGRPPETFKVVVIGGGTGLPRVLAGLKTYSHNLTAIVAVTDTGGHSGQLREIPGWGMLPPGDVRNVLSALASRETDSKRLARLFSFRFEFEEPGQPLQGVNLGNLLIAALTKLTGSFDRAIQEASDLLRIEGTVVPSTLADVDLCAVLDDGQVVEGETMLLADPPPGGRRIRRVFLKLRPSSRMDQIKPHPRALEAIAEADLIVLGPGALYTSVITNLVVPGLGEAVRAAAAPKIYVSNIVTQPGQTAGYSASQHIQAVLDHLGLGHCRRVPDFAAIVNTAAPDPQIEALYLETEGKRLVEVDRPLLNRLPVAWQAADLLDPSPPAEELKEGLLRHDPHKVADAICREYCKLIPRR